MSIPEHLCGDGPCSDCGTVDNPRWFTDSVFWNEVVRQGDYIEPILCINCFVKRVDAAGFDCNWRLLPEWHWETKAERSRRVEENQP